MQQPWGVTCCPECGDWPAEIQETRVAQIPDPDGDGVLDVIAYAAQCLCGGMVFSNRPASEP